MSPQSPSAPCSMNTSKNAVTSAQSTVAQFRTARRFSLPLQVAAPCTSWQRNRYTQRRDHGLREEVTGDQRVYVQPEEPPPDGLVGAATASRRWRQALILQNPAHGRSADANTELSQLTDNPAITPRVVLLRQTDDECSHVTHDLGPTGPLGLAPFPHFGYPARIRPRRDDPNHLRGNRVSWLRDHHPPRPHCGIRSTMDTPAPECRSPRSCDTRG